MIELVSFVSQVQPQHWLALAFVLLIAEVMTGTTYLLWPAAAAGVTGLAALAPAVAWPAQVALFALLTIVLTLVGRNFRARLYRTKPAVRLNERAADLVGQRGASAGPFVNGIGAVKINDSVWRAKSADSITDSGAKLEVLAVDGVTLTVKLAN